VADLFLYEVPHRGYTATLKLTEEDAEMMYGAAARKIRPCRPGVVPPPQTQPWGQQDAEAPVEAPEPEEKKAPAPRNKSRSRSRRSG